MVISAKLDLAEDMVVIADGIPEGLDEDFAEAAEAAFDSMPRAKRKDDGIVEEVVRTAIRREADNIWGKKPVCKVVVVRV